MVRIHGQGALAKFASFVTLALCAAGDVTPQTTIATTGSAATRPGAFYGSLLIRKASVPEISALGRALFFDTGLSESRKLACATCHDPRHAFSPPNRLPVQLGGARGTQMGLRATPSLRYIQSVPSFTEHMHDSEGDDSIDQGPAGGRTWDGRAQSIHDQARLPLLSRREMANETPDSVVAKLRRASYASKFRDVFGADVLDDPEAAFNAALLALEIFQQEPRDFYPYDSKYDAYLRAQTKLTPAEARGLALFNDPAKGNCAVCHPSMIKDGAFPQFTDYGYVAVGVPRNGKIPANHDPNFFDLGLCGPERTDLADKKEYCGMFRTPSLRNVATRSVFFHNGVFTDLHQAVAFYVERDIHPAKWYPRNADGTVRKFDDLPPQYLANVNRDAPFDRAPGDRPALSDAEIDDVVTFLGTLTDGFRP